MVIGCIVSDLEFAVCSSWATLLSVRFFLDFFLHTSQSCTKSKALLFLVLILFFFFYFATIYCIYIHSHLTFTLDVRLQTELLAVTNAECRLRSF